MLVSQDACQGDAEYGITVDGISCGGILTASSLHGSGQSDTVTVSGDWQAGPHSVSIVLLDDAWGGTPDTDRNLCLDGATYNGQPVSDTHSVAALMSSGAASFGSEGTAPEPEQIDWDALARRVLANYEATGQWFLQGMLALKRDRTSIRMHGRR